MSISVDNNVKNQQTTPALYSDVYANIPAFGQTGRLFFATDTNTIYRDTGSAWVVFLANATVPSGLTPIGTAGQILMVNPSATGLLYSSNYVDLTSGQTINGLKEFAQSTYFYDSIELRTLSSLRIGTSGTNTSTPTLSQANFLQDKNYTITVTPSGTITYTNQSSVIIYELTNTGTINLTSGQYLSGQVGASAGAVSNKDVFADNIATNGVIGIGSTAVGTATNLHIDENISGAVTSYGVNVNGVIQSGVTTAAELYHTVAKTAATAFTLTNLRHYQANQGTFGAGSAVTNQYGFVAASTLIGATNNYGFYSNIASATGRWNFYAAGTAANYFGGRVLCNLTSVPSGTTMTSNNLNIYNSFGVQNNDWSAGSAGTAMLFALSATSGAATGSLSIRTSGGTGSGTLILNSGGGSVVVGTVGSPAYNLQLGADSAAKPSTNTWTIASDSRVKTNIIPYTKGLTEILLINPVEYKYNGKAGFDPEQGGIGIIAQDIQSVLPETVNTYFAKLNEKDKKDTELLNFNSHALTFVLINAIKELKAEIDLLKQN